MFSVASYSIVAQLFEENLSTANGALEIFTGLGMILGPIAGSLLFSVGGFRLPFEVLGGAQVAVGIVLAVAMPTVRSQKSAGSFGFCSSLGLRVLPVALAVVFGNFVYGMLEPTLQPHLTAPPLNTPISTVGVIFAFPALCYAVVAPIVGYLDDNLIPNDRGFLLMSFGLVLISVSLLLLGPVPLLHWGLDMRLVWLAMVLAGVGFGFVMVPPLKKLNAALSHLERLARNSIASAIFNFSYACGGFLGPTVGGALGSAFGVPWAYAGGGAFGIFVVGVLALERCVPPARQQAEQLEHSGCAACA
eukprot:gnl/TRDRNA2_/TRDRNA2_45459_c1_seq1.p1 gnl/TRDRNA2_/TRDRNA2_45459_c1~~gnl/TRDRNA2_/TRDRNA2_45459_c1_seq1.p1  ORF type:complete len:327 (+),score=43.41 gnl/TRDRNA2_/TRDRNA2_45459_c1_seq1:70-981(+)